MTRSLPDGWLEAESEKSVDNDGEVFVGAVGQVVDKGEAHLRALSHQVVEELLVGPLWIVDGLRKLKLDLVIALKLDLKILGLQKKKSKISNFN